MGSLYLLVTVDKALWSSPFLFTRKEHDRKMIFWKAASLSGGNGRVSPLNRHVKAATMMASLMDSPFRGIMLSEAYPPQLHFVGQ